MMNLQRGKARGPADQLPDCYEAVDAWRWADRGGDGSASSRNGCLRQADGQPSEPRGGESVCRETVAGFQQALNVLHPRKDATI